VLTTYGVPAIVEAGVLLDVLVVVLLLTGVIVQIRQEHDSIDLDRLRELRG
jgi:hydrogenase-4 component E